MTSKARELANLGNAYSDGALSNRNLIINGAMQVAQRGTSFSGIGSATYTLDRWRGQSRAGSVVNVSRIDNVDVDGTIMSVLQHEVTTPASDGLTLQNQFIEDGSIAALGKTVTISCWARVVSGSATLEHGLEVDNGAYGFYGPATTLSTSFQKVVFTTTLSGYTTSISSKHLRYQAYIRGASAHTVQITGVQLEVGDTATPFEHRSYGQELALCQTPLASKHISYAKASIKGRQVLLHRLIAKRMGLSLDGVIDHINGNALDCRRSNLQACTHQQNIMKQRHQATAKSPYKGVMQFRDKWRARITVNGKTMHLGLFASANEAAIAYNEKAKELFGDFANLNEVA